MPSSSIKYVGVLATAGETSEPTLVETEVHQVTDNAKNTTNNNHNTIILIILVTSIPVPARHQHIPSKHVHGLGICINSDMSVRTEVPAPEKSRHCFKALYLPNIVLRWAR